MGRLLNKIGLTTWKRRLIALLIFLPVMGGTTVEITSQSWFCNSCHIMNPYYDSWKNGSHKDVACVKCHISPGVQNFLAAKFNGLGQVVDDILNRTSMKPSASVSQLSCVRSGCHDVERVKQITKTTGKYLFRHDKHLDLEFSGIKVACATCHSHVKGDKHFEVNTNVCVTCHLLRKDTEAPSKPVDASAPPVVRLAVREGQANVLAGPPPPADHRLLPPEACSSCHNPPAGTLERGGLKITHSEYLAYGAACESCHRGTTAAPVPVENGHCYQCHSFGLERSTDTETMHRTHNEGQHKIECFSCHGAVHHGPAAQAARLDQFDCNKCHTDQHGIQRRTYLNVPGGLSAAVGTAVSPMYLAHVDCTGCHTLKHPVSTRPDSGATVASATPESCDACHKPGFGREMVPLWQRTTHSLYDQLTVDVKAASAELTTDAGRAQLAEVRKLMDLVRVDGSWGVHNPRYAQQLLEQARTKLAAARAGSPAGAPP